MTTQELTKAIITYLREQGCFVWRQNNVPVFHNGQYRKMPFGSIHGVPDIIGCTPKGRAIYVEVKAGRDRLSEAQKKFIHETKRRGCIVIVARDITKFRLEYEWFIKDKEEQEEIA